MKYVLSNGHTYLTRKSNGKVTTTYDPGLAVGYDTEAKAWNVLEHISRVYKENGYLPKRIDVKEKTSQEKNDLVERQPPVQPKPKHGKGGVQFKPNDSEWLTEFKSNLLLVDKTLGSLKNTYTKMYEELTNVGDEIEDIEHAIEFQSANAVRRCYLENELKKARQRRRNCKDAMLLIETVRKFNLDDWGTGELPNVIDQLKHRHYVPKVRKDLFE